MDATEQKLKEWFENGGHALVKTAIDTEAYAEKIRKEVDSYCVPIFESLNFSNIDPKVTCEEMMFLLEESFDPLANQYYQWCNEAHKERGWKGADGTCPALTAEHEAVMAEVAMLASFSLACGMQKDAANCASTDLRKKIVNTLKALPKLYNDLTKVYDSIL